jgi:hypothetical protein
MDKAIREILADLVSGRGYSMGIHSVRDRSKTVQQALQWLVKKEYAKKTRPIPGEIKITPAGRKYARTLGIIRTKPEVKLQKKNPRLEIKKILAIIRGNIRALKVVDKENRYELVVTPKGE